METSTSLIADLGSDNANATEIPPLRPPHVKIGMAFFSKTALYLNKEMGMATVLT
jgi:hypothetical protein